MSNAENASFLATSVAQCFVCPEHSECTSRKKCPSVPCKPQRCHPTGRSAPDLVAFFLHASLVVLRTYIAARMSMLSETKNLKAHPGDELGPALAYLSSDRVDQRKGEVAMNAALLSSRTSAFTGVAVRPASGSALRTRVSLAVPAAIKSVE